MHTIARILLPLLLTGSLLAGTQGSASADVPTCDPGDYYALQVALTDAEQEVREVRRQAEADAADYAEQLTRLSNRLVDASIEASDVANLHAAEVRALEDQVAEERDERLDAERLLARADVRIDRLLARVRALRAAR